MSKTADVVVIGGGVNGCSTAYYLAKSGVKNVVLVEKDHIASGPTGLSSGIVRQYYTLEPLAMMARDSVRVLANFKELVGGDAGFVQCGAVFFCAADAEGPFRDAVAMHHRIGIHEELVTPSELAEMEPGLVVDDISLGAYEPAGGYADPSLVANSYCKAAEQAGVEVLRGTEVTGFNIHDGSIRGVSTNRGKIATEKVAMIAGPWGRRLAAMVGVNIPISVSRHPVIVLERPDAWRNPTHVWLDLIRGWYFKPEGNHGMMVGCLTEVESDRDVEIEPYNARTQYEETVAYTEAILHRFPVMEQGTATAGWAGLYDASPDGVPVIDELPGAKGLFCAIGFSGHGFKTAPALGALMTELITTGRCTRYDIDIFRYGRFREGKLTPSKSAYQIIG